MNHHPFSHRETRINRREERNLFRRRLIPLAWVLAAVGGGGLLIAAGTWLIHGEWPYSFAGPFAALAALPFVLIVIGWLRGHSSRRLEEP